MGVLSFIVEHHQAILAGAIAILTGVTAIAMVIPGEQPEKTLQKIVDVLAKFSRK